MNIITLLARRKEEYRDISKDGIISYLARKKNINVEGKNGYGDIMVLIRGEKMGYINVSDTFPHVVTTPVYPLNAPIKEDPTQLQVLAERCGVEVITETRTLGDEVQIVRLLRKRIYGWGDLEDYCRLILPLKEVEARAKAYNSQEYLDKGLEALIKEARN